jgi:hypothetical protein
VAAAVPHPLAAAARGTNPANPAARSGLRRVIAGLLLFGISFGFVEAAVVVYLRALSQPIRIAAGLPADDVFPLLDLGQLGPVLRLLKIELIREAATLAMLASVALVFARDPRTWLAAFAVAFGVWDLSFYSSLAILIHWPPSLMTWDLLFLLPVPWSAPVLAPAIVAATLVIGGIAALLRTPPRVKWIARVGFAASLALLLAAFMWDWRSILAGGLPRDFPWLLFAAGEALGLSSTGIALLS